MTMRGLSVALWLAIATPVLAQDPVQTDVLVVDTDTVAANSLYGVRLEQRFEAAAQALVAENDRIEAELTAEEKALTKERATLAPDVFRQKADAFDEKVIRIRAEQDAKASAVQAIREEGRSEFIQALTEVLADIARERGAVIVLEQGQVFLSASSIDVTDQAIQRLNEALSDPSATPQEDAGDE